jgi:hypothetical protein
MIPFGLPVLYWVNTKTTNVHDRLHRPWERMFGRRQGKLIVGDVSGEVLELRVGTGQNLEYYITVLLLPIVTRLLLISAWIEDHPYIDYVFSISSYPLSGASTLSRIMGGIGHHWGVV